MTMTNALEPTATMAVDKLLERLKHHDDAAACIRTEIEELRKRLTVTTSTRRAVTRATRTSTPSRRRGIPRAAATEPIHATMLDETVDARDVEMTPVTTTV